jgi:hypothetical protein
MRSDFGPDANLFHKLLNALPIVWLLNSLYCIVLVYIAVIVNNVWFELKNCTESRINSDCLIQWQMDDDGDDGL